MLRPTTLVMAAFVMFAGVGIAQAGPRARAAHHAAHQAHRAAHWVAEHRPNVVVDWRLAHPHAHITVVEGISVPSIGGTWSITMKDATGHFQTVKMSGSTPDAAVSAAKMSFKATGHGTCGQIVVTQLEWAGE